MDLVVEVIGHPLTLLVVGAALTGLLLPWVTRTWQDQRKALEIKAALVERVSSAVQGIATAVQFALVGAASQTQEQFDAAYRAWQLEKSVLTALLGAYFRDPAVPSAWTRCRALATAYYVQAGIGPEPRRVQYLGSVAAGLTQQPPEDVSDGTSDARTDEARGQALADPRTLRAELDRALAACVSAIVDTRLTLGGRR
jgi:hypothetical protein